MVNAFDMPRLRETRKTEPDLKIIKKTAPQEPEILAEFDAKKLAAKAKNIRAKKLAAPAKFGKIKHALPPLPGRAENYQAADAEIISEYEAAPTIAAAESKRRALKARKSPLGKLKSIDSTTPEADGIDVEETFDKETQSQIAAGEPIFEDIDPLELSQEFARRETQYLNLAERYLRRSTAEAKANPFLAKACEYAWRKSQLVSLLAGRLARAYKQGAALNSLPNEGLEKAKLLHDLKTRGLVGKFQAELDLLEKAETEVASEQSIGEQLVTQKQELLEKIDSLRQQEQTLQADLSNLNVKSINISNGLLSAFRQPEKIMTQAEIDIKTMELEKTLDSLNDLIDEANSQLPAKERLVSPREIDLQTAAAEKEFFDENKFAEQAAKVKDAYEAVSKIIQEMERENKGKKKKKK